jgi:1,4-dihydroxy-2-naphthoate octaprenyltransferase
MQQDLQEFETLPPQRPLFLKVLCILTFIGSSYAIITSAVSYFNADTVANVLTSTKEQMNKDLNDKSKTTDPAGNGFANKVMDNMSVMSNPENLRKSSLGTIISSVFCLIGAILMWRLNRTGFWLYTLGTIIGVIVPFYVFGNNFLTALSVGFASFIGVLFVIFYAMNLKSMKKR